MKAKYLQTCRKCSKDIQPGQQIQTDKKFGWIHSKCSGKSGQPAKEPKKPGYEGKGIVRVSQDWKTPCGKCGEPITRGTRVVNESGWIHYSCSVYYVGEQTLVKEKTEVENLPVKKESDYRRGKSPGSYRTRY